MRRKYPLWLLIGTIFTVLIIVVSFALGFSGYHMVQRATRTATIQLAEQISKITKLSLMEIQRSAHLSIASHLGGKKTFSGQLNSWRLLAHDLNAFPFLNTVFIGYENGDFFPLRHCVRKRIACNRTRRITPLLFSTLLETGGGK